MTTASAPGKIILFGEHAVVSGVTALGSAIDLRARVTVQDLSGSVLIKTKELTLKGFSLDLTSGRLESAQAAHATDISPPCSENLRSKIFKFALIPACRQRQDWDHQLVSWWLQWPP